MPPLSVFESEIGGEALATVRDTLEWLYSFSFQSINDLDSRLAPSMVARAESEYLGISSPRFAVRVKFENDNSSGFLNVRRLRELNRSITSRYKIDRLPRPLTGAIADSVLPVPKRLVDGRFFCLTSELGQLYEEDAGSGVPYVAQMDWLGGGVCADCAGLAVAYALIALR
jgi:hypothetical protein